MRVSLEGGMSKLPQQILNGRGRGNDNMGDVSGEPNNSRAGAICFRLLPASPSANLDSLLVLIALQQRQTEWPAHIADRAAAVEAKWRW
jgi:hypothetical protein